MKSSTAHSTEVTRISTTPSLVVSHKVLAIVVVLSSLLASACANYATFQEADTLGKGQGKTGFGATGTTYKVQNDDGTQDSVTVPALNIWRRQGLTDHLEAHASVWIPLGASLGFKYQLIGNRKTAGLAVSLGLDGGFLQVGAKDTAGDEVKTTIIDTYVPLYVGFRTGESFAFYVTPKYIFRYSTAGATDHLAGGTAGIALGSGSTFLLEGTVIYDTGLKAPAIQGGIGVAF